jgi:hypothetical protein
MILTEEVGGRRMLGVAVYECVRSFEVMQAEV